MVSRFRLIVFAGQGDISHPQGHWVLRNMF